MNTHQIAAEAARGWFSETELGKTRAAILTGQLTCIIEAAIEKATKQVCKQRDAWKRVANWDESRAVHASEDWTVERLVTALGFGLDGPHMKDMRKSYQKVVDEINAATRSTRERAAAVLCNNCRAVSEPPFDASKHHASCTPNDQDLMWVCAQCGHKEPEEKQT